MNDRFHKIFLISLFVISVLQQALCSNQFLRDPLINQSGTGRSKYYVGLCAGMNFYYGDLVKSNLYKAPFYKQYGALINMERELSNSVRLCAGFFSGNILGEEHSAERNLNFKTSLLAPHLSISYKFSNLIFGRKSHVRFATYMSAGVEKLFFSPSGDLKNSNGATYYYWNDGSIRDIPENSLNSAMAVPIKRDYVYETDYRNLNIDNAGNYPRSTISFPFGIAAEMKMNDALSIRAGAIYHYTKTDYLDNITVHSIGSRKGNAATDKFLFVYAGIFYHIPLAVKHHTTANDCGFKKNMINHMKSVKK